MGTWLLPLTAAGATTSTTTPGPAPNQSQINSTESQVAQIESTLTQEEQQTSILDDKYNTAVQTLQNDQTEEQSLAAQLVSAKAAVKVDRHLVANDAVQAYIYGTPETGFASYFSQSASQSVARNQYTNEIVGNLQKDEGALRALRIRSRLRADAGASRRGGGPVRSRAGQVARQRQRAGSGNHEVDPRPGAGSAGLRGCPSGDPRGTAGGSRGGTSGQPAGAPAGRGGGGSGGHRGGRRRWILERRRRH